MRCCAHILLMLALVAAPAAGQTTRPAAPAPAPPATPDSLLAGPRVPESAKGDGEAAAFTGRRRGAATVPARRWFALVGELDLTQEQRSAIAEIGQALRAESRAFEREYGQEWRQLNAEVRDRDRDAAPPPGMEKRLEELRGLRPRPEGYQMGIWSLLDPDQQQALRSALAEARRRMAERRAADRRMQDG